MGLDVEKLRKDIYKKIDDWDERGQFIIENIRNLSLGDLHTLLVLCDEYESTGSLNGVILNKVEKTILKRYGWEG